MRMQTMELFTVRNWVTAGLVALAWSTMGFGAAQAASPGRSTTMALASEQPRSMESEARIGRHLMSPIRPVDMYNLTSGIRVRKMVADALAYVIDNDGDFPESARTFAQSVADDCGDGVVSYASSGVDELFSYNTALAGAKRSGIHDPSHTVLVYEGAFGHLAFRHHGRTLIAFVDGHVEELNPGQAAVVKWKP